MSVPWLALAAAAVLALVHLLAGRLRFLDTLPRSRWLSAAGGVSVAYVFVHLLPELSEAQEAIAEAAAGVLPFLERHVYLLALLGLAVFYGLERTSLRSRSEHRARHGVDQTEAGVGWLSIGTYAAYNVLIGYLLTQREGGLREVGFFALAMAVHFLANDHGLRDHHRDLYHRVGRWVCAGAVLGGCLVGAVTEVSEAAIGLLLAFIAGGVILNVLKEELPAERESRFSAFALGAVGYAALLLLV